VPVVRAAQRGGVPLCRRGDRPSGPAHAEPQQWRQYLYHRRNACGWVQENWYHSAGCRKYIRLERETLTNQTRPAGAAR